MDDYLLQSCAVVSIDLGNGNTTTSDPGNSNTTTTTTSCYNNATMEGNFGLALFNCTQFLSITKKF